MPDIIGIRYSDKSGTDEYRMDYFVRFLQALLDSMNFDRPIVLCGHSFTITS
jgi:pimeloyl-ACP methyl ester carboxylesterase